MTSSIAVGDRQQPNITLGRDDAGSHWNACFYDAAGECVCCSSWQATPETAVVVLLDKLREKTRDLHARGRIGLDDDNERDLYLWLCGMFR